MLHEHILHIIFDHAIPAEFFVKAFTWSFQGIFF